MSDSYDHHIPVLLHESLVGLQVRRGGVYCDATVGGGGHAQAILEASASDGRLLALDRDPEAASRASQRLSYYGERVKVVNASYTRILEIAEREEFLPLDGLLFDLGYSSWQIDDSSRGFSFLHDGPLDMRFNAHSDGITAADIVNVWDEQALAELFWTYGEESRGRHYAKAITQARPFQRTGELAQVIADSAGGRRSRIHPATKVFQALRIAVNDELSGLEQTLPLAIEALASGGRLAVITFHSLEDRLVKHFMRREARDCICPPDVPVCQCDHERSIRLITRKPISPANEEVQANPRSRSAKLRIAEKL